MYMEHAFSLSASQPGISWPDPVWLLEAERTFLGGLGVGVERWWRRGWRAAACAVLGVERMWEKTPYSPIDLLIPA